ncbi:MAG TPA: adenylate/guanylate cyclase domain-containing protein, partial [Candidatus Limnocylindria bacterium]
DSDEARLRKAILVGIALLIATLAAFWGLLYVAFGEALGGAIPLTYTVISLGSVVMFAITRRYDWFRFTQLTVMLILPFALMVVLGGFVPSSVVVAWAFVAPLGALAFATPREAVRWYIAYVGLVVLTGVLGGSVRSANNLPPGLVLAFFILNLVGVSLVVFLALYASVRERDHALEVMRRLFGQYLSPQIARALLKDPEQARLGGENRDITALFADLQGFTPFTESHPPAETVRVLNRYFSAVVPVIFANGGTIIQFAGDAIVAVFNAPLEQPRHALAAARTALAMQAAIEAIVRDDAALPRFRVGVASGAALVGNVGSEEFRNFVAHGDTVNLAARLQTGAQAGQVVISSSTYALVRDLARVRPLGLFSVKGKSEEVQAFVLEAVLP